jgi:PAS domain S-box-containing protein
VIGAHRLAKGLPLDRHLMPVLTVVFVGVLLSTLLAYFYTKNTVEGLALGQTTQTLSFLDREVSARIKEMRYDLRLWSQEDVFRLALEDNYLGQSAREAAQRRLNGRAMDNELDRVFLIRSNGDILLTSGPEVVQRVVTVKDRKYFSMAMTGENALDTVPSSLYSGRPILVAAAPIKGPDNTVSGVLASGIDTERFAREALKGVSIGKSGIGLVLNHEGVVLAASARYTPGEALDKDYQAKVLESLDTSKIVLCRSNGHERMVVARTNEATGWRLVLEADEAEILLPASRLAWISGAISLATIGLVSMALGGLRRAMTRLRQSEEKFSKLFLLSPDSILLLELDTFTIVDANETFTRLSGYSRAEVLGKTTLELDIYADKSVRRTIYERLLPEGRFENLEFEARRKDGGLSPCSLSAQVLEIGAKRYIMAIVRDVAELKKMQEMMIQTEKMISVGGIAAGIAHEINNPLGIVLQAAQNLIQRTRTDFKKNIEAAEKIGLDMKLLEQYMKARSLDVFIADIQSAASRASVIIKNMLDFSRRSESKRTVCDIAALADRAVDLASSDYDLKKSYDFKKIEIVREYEPDLPGVDCTATEIEQVVLNLLRNAAQAMAAAVPSVAKPRITIRVKNLDQRVRIEVEDNGPGVPEPVRRRIFEPFYTTKQPGEGTGLGLSVSYFIVAKGHGGEMWVNANASGGACFVVDLPKQTHEDA